MTVSQQKLSGAYFTPDLVAQALVYWAIRQESDRLLDPSCGDGRFLAAHPRSVGIEQDPRSAADAIARAPGALVHDGDFFQWAESTKERFECCAGNPPFIRYQHFSGEVRQRALSLCAAQGAQFTGLTSSWAPFIVAAASLLKRGGRMAFVVPAEIGHAPYASPLLEYLISNFATVQVIAVREKLFPQLSEDCWLLYADGFGGMTKEIRFTALEKFEWGVRPPTHHQRIPVNEWRNQWNRRLRPFLASFRTRNIYIEMAEMAGTARLADFAQVGIGYVSGDNSFFHLRPSEARRWQIPDRFLHPTVRNSRALPKKNITPQTVKGWTSADEAVLLLRLQGGQDLPTPVKGYLDSEAGRAARNAYKCRTRAPWYAVPDVQVPDFVLTYMAGRTPQLVRNNAGVTCTNTIHSVRLKDAEMSRRLLPSWGTPAVELSCELEGHPLGGGMLKLEVREASRIAFPDPAWRPDRAAMHDLKAGVVELRRWRHYAD